MAINRFFTPKVVIKNISNKIIRIINVPIEPGKTVDLYKSLNVPVELFEFQIIKALEKPYGDLYVEQEIKKTIKIIALQLAAFSSDIEPSRVSAVNSPIIGDLPTFFSTEQFEWVRPVSVVTPLVINSNNTISLPSADGVTDGYLSKTDWLRFNASVKGDLRIWQYQDFPAPVSDSLAISTFENGTGLTFNSSYIIDGSAKAVLVNNTSRPPTTTTAFPGNLLPGNRIVVSSHIGTTVVFNDTPDTSQNIRVFFLISLPATVKLPNDYQEDPEFANNSSLEYGDELYVNRNEDEDIYGIKTFEGNVVINSGLRITTDVHDGYYLRSDASGNAFWDEVVGVGGGGGGGASELDDLSDVNLVTTTPFVGSLLGYDGVSWVPLEGETMYNKEVDETLDGYLYIGEALPGAATSSASWRIQRVIFTSIEGEDVSIKWADGDALFDNIWDDRLSKTYS
jgi:hypothetical protein